MKKNYFFSLAIVCMCLMCFSLAGCSSGTNAGSNSTTRMVQNSEGAAVEVPSEITKAVPVIGAFAQMTEIVAGPGKIVAAATSNVSDYFKTVFPDYTESNPNNYDASSVEGIIAAGAQVVYGPDSSYSDEQKAQLKQAGIPFVAINNMKTVDDMCDSFLIIGDIFGEAGKTRAQNFVDYYQGNIDKTKKITSTITIENKVTILDLRYSGGAYSTINGTDICNEYFEAAGGINVAKDYTSTGSGTGLTVNTEQIVAWNPQVIMAFNQPAKEAILSDPTLADVQAVKTGKVYVCPQGVYNWSVRSGEGAMLPLWLGTVMYPDLFSSVDMNKTVSDFFSNYYSYKISSDEIAKVLAGSKK